MIKVKIAGSGAYLPHKVVSTNELGKEFRIDPETMRASSGVHFRRYASSGETASKMGAMAAREALANAKIDISSIDLLISASGTMQMPIPYTAALIHKELGLKQIPAFDVNTTCLSFVTAFDLAASLIDSGKYRNVLIVSSEIASCGLNPNDPETLSLFGDGAAACIVTKAESSESSCLLASSLQTHSEGTDICRIEGGGTAYPPQLWKNENSVKFQFQMRGKELFKMVSKLLPTFVESLLKTSHLTISEIDKLVPHQASGSAIRIVTKKLGLPCEKVVNVIADYGNMIAASIPLALHQAIQAGNICRGDKLLLLGTSAGLSIGGIILTY